MNDYGFPQWLKYLMDVMRPNWKENANGLGNETAKAIALLDSFYDEQNEKMLTAVKGYLSNKQDAYIPFPGELSACFPREKASLPRSRSRLHWSLHEMQAWPVCPRCQEHTQSLTDCPFCADMQTAVAYNELSDAERERLYLMETAVEMVTQ